ncbi:MAG: protein kinase [Labilithrix sp.]|nr:protein kinase [Labilithrix sp.]
MEDLDEARERARAAREALVGKTIADRYTLRALLGHGGMGAVYDAEHLVLGKRVAIKFVDPEFATDDKVRKRFSREARAMSAIESAHIVTVFDFGTEEGRPYLVMELLRGEDLGQRLRRTTRVPLREAMHVIAQVLKGLARAHAAGIVHRDLKPDNVFIVKHDTDPLFAKIVDFGISKIERPRANTSPLALTGRGTVLGTPFYMSPEQAQCSSEVDGRTDLYSVGAILFECLTGRPPHTGESYEQVILAICMRDAPKLASIDASIPENVSAFVARALARDRDQRFTSAERMLAALHEVAPEERTRVPLDPPSAQTLKSPTDAPLDATMLDGGQRRSSSPSGPSGSGSESLSAATRFGVASLAPTVPDLEGVSLPAEALPSRTPSTTPSPGVAKAKASPRPAAHASDPPPRPKRESQKPAGRPYAAAIATAAVATLMGVAVTIGIISMLEKKPADPIALPPRVSASATTTIASASPEPVAPSSAPASSEPAASSLPVASASGKLLPAAPTARPAGPPPSPKPTPTKLDIQRDLP